MTATEQPTLAIVDCETTGLDPRIHQIWELAVILRTGDDGDEEHVWQIRPDLDTADPEALEINRFHDRFKVPGDDLDALWFPDDGGPPWKQTRAEALTEIQDLLRGAYLVGAVPSFDAMMLTCLLRSLGLRVPWHHRLVCVETLVAGALGLAVPQGLRKAAGAVGVAVDEDARHTAMGDARLARDVYDAVMATRQGDG